ncbi:MAG: response regulator [Nitrospirae bacterium]|nr:response regulator [Nitrospirota bacterium]MBF0536357.1 response regulator [Nitrospirota bacterium]MBF0616588.1 response regulator [Nitrospirota bacterium]
MIKGKVLVLDDEAIVRISCKRVLEAEGYNVSVASSVKEAVTLLEKEHYALVITDLLMPDVDGLEFLEIIKHRWPSLRAIVMTGYGTQEARQKSLALGALEFLKKPFLPEELVSVVMAAGNARMESYDDDYTRI